MIVIDVFSKSVFKREILKGCVEHVNIRASQDAVMFCLDCFDRCLTFIRD